MVRNGSGEMGLVKKGFLTWNVSFKIAGVVLVVSFSEYLLCSQDFGLVVTYQGAVDDNTKEVVRNKQSSYPLSLEISKEEGHSPGTLTNGAGLAKQESISRIRNLMETPQLTSMYFSTMEIVYCFQFYNSLTTL